MNQVRELEREASRQSERNSECNSDNGEWKLENVVFLIAKHVSTEIYEERVSTPIIIK